MEAPRKIPMSEIRGALQSLGCGGKEVSNALIYESRGVQNEEDKDIIRTRVAEMARSGEAARTDRGSFVYNFSYRARKSAGFESIWRFVRAAKPGWSMETCALMTRASYSHVCRYVNWLRAEGYVECQGRDGSNKLLFRNTGKARANPETPDPPIKPTDPFAKERMAAATITRLMLCADPYAVKTGRDICEACRVLLARFEKNNTESRTINENETKMEECHVE